MVMEAESQFHVLAVDDSIIDRKLIEKLLKTSSYQVTTVDSGTKALKFLGLNEYDDDINPSSPDINHLDVEVNLVITDYCMPGMTGFDLLKKIKESSFLKNIPVVIMSSENVPSRITRCLEEGAEEFFLKPMKLADMSRLKPHMLKSMKRVRKNDQVQETESKNTEAKLQLLEEEQQQAKKRKSVDEEDHSSTRRRSRYDELVVVL